MKGVPFLSKIVYKRVRGWTAVKWQTTAQPQTALKFSDQGYEND